MGIFLKKVSGEKTVRSYTMTSHASVPTFAKCFKVFLTFAIFEWGKLEEVVQGQVVRSLLMPGVSGWTLKSRRIPGTQRLQELAQWKKEGSGCFQSCYQCRFTRSEGVGRVDPHHNLLVFQIIRDLFHVIFLIYFFNSHIFPQVGIGLYSDRTRVS